MGELVAYNLDDDDQRQARLKKRAQLLQRIDNITRHKSAERIGAQLAGSFESAVAKAAGYGGSVEILSEIEASDGSRTRVAMKYTGRD